MIGRRSKTPAGEVDKPKGFDDFDLRLGDLMRGERATMGKSLLDIQRDLKIKATYISAIENADVSAFETPGFIAGYVRSYARYLGMNPDLAFERFCREAKFEVAHGMSAAASSQSVAAVRARQNAAEGRDPISNPNIMFSPRQESVFARMEPGVIGSFAVLFALIGLLGFGGWSVLQEVQRVELAPVEQAPSVVAELDPLQGVTPVASAPLIEADPARLAAETGVATDPLGRILQPQALDVPVLTSRDGPIAAIDPRETGVLATDLVTAAVDGAVETPDTAVQVVAAANAGVELLAVRPSWVQVSAADGTVLFEKILDAGERYAVPPLEQAALLRSGNSGSVYFLINGTTYGPAAPGANVVKNVALSAESLTAAYVLADVTADADLASVITAANTVIDPQAGAAGATGSDQGLPQE